MSHVAYYTESKQFLIPQKEERKSYLLTPLFDVLCMGGASVIFYFISTILIKHSHSYFAKIIFFSSFLVNFPHFMLSYQLLYIDFRHFIFSKFSFFWAGIIVPAILVTTLILASHFDPISHLGYFVNALFFFVGWHYTKQIFGTIIVTNALQKIFYNKIERWSLQINLFTLWVISWVWNNIGNSEQIYEGILFRGLNFSRRYLIYCLMAIIITLVFALIIHVRKHIRERSKPSLAALISFIAAYVWFIPLFYNPLFFPCIAFFHSLQYLPFVYAVRRNKIESELEKSNPENRMMIYCIRHYGYLFLSVVLGAIFFYFLPNYLNQMRFFDFDVLGTLMMFYFVIFLNIHHYFIDNVIWKKNNEQMQKYLFQQK